MELVIFGAIVGSIGFVGLCDLAERKLRKKRTVSVSSEKNTGKKAAWRSYKRSQYVNLSEAIDFKEVIMLLFWIVIAIIIGVGESISDSYSARKNPYQTPDCFKPKPWQEDWINKNRK